MKYFLLLLAFLAFFSVSAQRQYRIIKDVSTGKYTLRIDEATADGSVIRGAYTETEYTDTAAVTTAILARRQIFINAAAETQLTLNAITAERDSLTALLSSFWSFRDGGGSSRTALPSPEPPPEKDKEPPKNKARKTRKTRKQ